MKSLGKMLAFVLVLALVGAGTATAAKMITGKEIANGTVKGVDIAKGTLKANHLTDSAKVELQGAAGPAGPQGPAGPEGPAGQDGGPHRYAEVSDAGGRQEHRPDPGRPSGGGPLLLHVPGRRPPDLRCCERSLERHDRDPRHLRRRRVLELPAGRERPGAHVRPLDRRLPGQPVPPDPLEQLGGFGERAMSVFRQAS